MATKISAAREKIIATAHDLFYRNGIRATGIDLIISNSEVTKVTFYRHFPSKNDLILEYLKYRHEMWISWFSLSIEKNKSNSTGFSVLIPVLQEWFLDPKFRGCAFINAVAELGDSIPQYAEICKNHKIEMMQIISKLVTNPKERQLDIQAIAMVVDGAIISSQINENCELAVLNLTYILNAIETRENKLNQ